MGRVTGAWELCYKPKSHSYPAITQQRTAECHRYQAASGINPPPHFFPWRSLPHEAYYISPFRKSLSLHFLSRQTDVLCTAASPQRSAWTLRWCWLVSDPFRLRQLRLSGLLPAKKLTGISKEVVSPISMVLSLYLLNHIDTHLLDLCIKHKSIVHLLQSVDCKTNRSKIIQEYWVGKNGKSLRKAETDQNQNTVSGWTRWLSRHLPPSHWRVCLILPTWKTLSECIYILSTTGHMWGGVCSIFKGVHRAQFLCFTLLWNNIWWHQCSSITLVDQHRWNSRGWGDGKLLYDCFRC